MVRSGRGSDVDDGRAASVLDEMRRRQDEPDGDDPPGHRWASFRSQVFATLHRLEVRTVLAVGAGVIVLAIVVATVVVRSASGVTEAEPPVTVPAVTTSVPTTTGPSGGVVVQAAGAVRSPGVYRLPVGARVVDLLDRAGGPAVDLDLDRTNLAALLVDGTRVWLPRIGESAPMVVGGPGSAPASGPALVDLNHATAEQLDTLPGIGPTLAAAIIADREKKGPFRSVDDLARVKGLTRSRIDAVRELVLLG